MRGKTNIGDGMSLNANTVNKTIKSGQISAGDFVEYYSDTPYIEQSSDIDFVFPFGNYSIALASGVITAFKNGEAVDSYAGYNCQYIGKDDNENFIVFHDNSAGILGVLAIDDDEFELVNTLQTSDTTAARTYITIGGGKVCYTKRRYIDSSHDYIDIGVASISAAGVLSNFNLTSITNDSSHKMASSNSFGFIGYSSGFYFVYAAYETSNPSYIAHIEIGSNNTASISSYSNITLSSGGNPRLIYKKGNIAVITSKYSGGASNGYMYILNFVTGNHTDKNMADYGEIYSFINEGKFLASGKDSFSIRYSNGSYSTTIAYKLKLYEFNENTYEISLIDEIVLNDNYSGYPQNFPFDCFSMGISKNVAGIDNNHIYAQVKGKITGMNGSTHALIYQWSKNLYLYEIINGSLQELTDHDFVRPYQAGNPIGVAKISGNTNDIIPVYIPTPAV